MELWGQGESWDAWDPVRMEAIRNEFQLLIWESGCGMMRLLEQGLDK